MTAAITYSPSPDQVALVGTLQSLHSYTYDAAGDRITASDNAAQTTYTYDASHQLLSESGVAGTISYTYEASNNRAAMTTSAGTTQYTYDTATHTELTSKTDPNGKVTGYIYDTSGNLIQATYDQSGANQVTRYAYDPTTRLQQVTKPDGSSVTFTYDANGQRVSAATTSGGVTTTIHDYYQLGQLAYQTDSSGNLLASYTYDSQGMPVSVAVGPDPSNPTTTPRYWYVYNAHGDVAHLVDANGNSVASYTYDTWGKLISASESIPSAAGGWFNPYRYDGRDGVRYDASDGLDWMRVRAYDPTLGRFISHDPLGRTPLFTSDNPSFALTSTIWARPASSKCARSSVHLLVAGWWSRNLAASVPDAPRESFSSLSGAGLAITLAPSPAPGLYWL